MNFFSNKSLNSSDSKPIAANNLRVSGGSRGGSSDSDDTDSSDEELTSPTIIKSKAEPHPSMEIDPATSTG